MFDKDRIDIFADSMTAMDLGHVPLINKVAKDTKWVPTETRRWLMEANEIRLLGMNKARPEVIQEIANALLERLGKICDFCKLGNHLACQDLPAGHWRECECGLCAPYRKPEMPKDVSDMTEQDFKERNDAPWET